MCRIYNGTFLINIIKCYLMNINMFGKKYYQTRDKKKGN